MKVFISVDLEGVAGIAHPLQTRRGADDYPAARRLMAAEANAAVAGAFDGGAHAVVVNDSHGDMTNLDASVIDERAELILGSPKVTASMCEGLDLSYGVALFVGYHAGAGTASAVLDHTFSGKAFSEIRLNGDPMSEAEINAAVAGAHNVPVGLVTGDDKACEQAEKRLPGVRTVVVKHSMGRHVARSVSPKTACDAIRAAAAATVANAADLRPYRPERPLVFEMDGRSTLIAELCALVPGSRRTGARTVEFQAADVLEGFQCLQAWKYLAASAP